MADPMTSPTADATAIALTGPFADVLRANQTFQRHFRWGHIASKPAKGIALVMCMDSRIDPLAAMGLGPGDAKIMRNAGARVTDDVLRSLVLAVNLLDVRRIAVIQHTDCAMTKMGDDELRTTVGELAGADATAWDFLPITDQQSTIAADLERVRTCALIDDEVELGGFIYDVHTGELRPVD